MEGGGLRFPLGSAGTPDADGPALPPTGKRVVDPRLLEAPVDTLPGVGRILAGRFASIGISTVGDLLLHLPFRHEPPSRLCPVTALHEGETATVRVRVRSCSVRSARRRNLKILEAVVSDDSGAIVAVWYNQAYLEEAFSSRPELLIRGALARRAGSVRFVVQSHEILSDHEGGLHTLGLVPVYPATGDISVRVIRGAVARAKDLAVHLVDPVPSRILAARRYPAKRDAVLACHFPATEREARVARNRLAFEELLLLQIALLKRRQREQQHPACAIGPPGGLSRRFLEALPFLPTSAQRKVMAEVDGDLTVGRPMLRLLQGDVGSGKTMVAVYALLRAVESGGQAALMAPTEVLADQHALRLAESLEEMGIRMGLLKSSLPTSVRRDVTAGLVSGELSVVVGTHALIQDGVDFRDLRVAVIDEQHRFGVRQRDALRASMGSHTRPHVLHMTATPIPRTLSLTLYGDLDISTLDELPPGRTPVRTRLVQPDRQPRAWQFMRDRLTAGEQAYVVCPLIEEGDSAQEFAATSVYAKLRRGELEEYRLGLLHGALSSAEKQTAMMDFAEGRTQVLVATTVIEVGIDVPNATVMAILGARRFGLSQLHQLRGRVGRGERSSYCLLFLDETEEDPDERLTLFASTTDGFKLAEADLRLRGEGHMFGDKQSGYGDLRVARLLYDQALLVEARKEAAALLASDPRLEGATEALLAAASSERFGMVEHWLDKA